jgi:hypothetical protein
MAHKIAVNWLACRHTPVAIPSSITPSDTSNPESCFVFLRPSTQIPGKYFKTSHNSFLPVLLNPSQYQSTVCAKSMSTEWYTEEGRSKHGKGIQLRFKPSKSQTASEFCFINYMTWKASCLAGCKNLEAITLRLWEAYAANKCQCGRKVSMNPSVRRHK